MKGLKFQQSLREIEQVRSHSRRLLVEYLPHIVWFVDPVGRFTYVNSRWFEYSGLDLEATEKGEWHGIIHPDDRFRMLQMWEDALLSRAPCENQLRVRRKSDGAYLWHLCRITPMVDETGEIFQWVGTWTDIEGQKQLQQETEAQLAEALAMVQRRDEFVSVASHELRTPLTSLMIHLNRFKLTRSAGAIEHCEAQARRLSYLVNELLDLTQIGLGRLKLTKEPGDFAWIVRETASRAATELGALGRLVSIQAEVPIPGLFDSNRIEQIVSNLVSNAIKYGRGRPVLVRAEKTPRANRVRLTVEDQGLGIPAEMQSRIFERFERVASGTSISGLGLGLYIVKQIVEAHGGTIRVASEPGMGARFTVELPLDASLSG